MAESGRANQEPRRSVAIKRMLVPAAALGMLLGLGASEALGAVTWSGTWSRDEHPGETMVLVQAPNGTVTGNYTWQAGSSISGAVSTVTGVVKGPRLRLTGDWSDAAFPGGGKFTITMDQSLKQYRGGFGIGGPGNLPFNGVCIAGPCLANTPPPQPPETNWRWVSDAWRNVGSGTRIRVRSGRHVYRLYRVRFRARGSFDAFGTRARVLRSSQGARTQIGLQFIYKRVGARRFRTYRINLHKFSGENYIKSANAETLITAARTTSRARGCQAWTRMWFTERTRGSDRAVIRFLARCRIPGGRVTRIAFRDTKNGRARVVIAPR